MNYNSHIKKTTTTTTTRHIEPSDVFFKLVSEILPNSAPVAPILRAGPSSEEKEKGKKNRKKEEKKRKKEEKKRKKGKHKDGSGDGREGEGEAKEGISKG